MTNPNAPLMDPATGGHLVRLKSTGSKLNKIIIKHKANRCNKLKPVLKELNQTALKKKLNKIEIQLTEHEDRLIELNMLFERVSKLVQKLEHQVNMDK